VRLTSVRQLSGRQLSRFVLGLFFLICRKAFGIQRLLLVLVSSASCNSLYFANRGCGLLISSWVERDGILGAVRVAIESGQRELRHRCRFCCG